MNEKNSAPVKVADLMAESGVAFGTSGARGLVVKMTDRVCATYLLAFLGCLKEQGRLEEGSAVAIGGDRRPSTPRILRALGAALESAGYVVDHQGLVPSPALALHGMEKGIPTVMVTGSHIPADRNGMKFTTREGEIKKSDEAAIKAASVLVPDLFNSEGMLTNGYELPIPSQLAEENYVERYLRAFPQGFLAGKRVGVYGHSAVGRDVLGRLYAALGAEIVPLAFSETFVPVDTEAIREEDIALAFAWAKDLALDAIVSTDGDSDRPLLADEKGEWLRGDVLGIHTARYFAADGVATPVSCNGALELCASFPGIVRTRIGSPFVIEGMESLAENGARRVVGYEANGGFLHASSLPVPEGGVLGALPTRDPVIVHLATLGLAATKKLRLSELAGTLPPRFTASGRDTSFRPERSRTLLAALRAASEGELLAWFSLGPVAATNEIDGLRFTFASGDVVHLRPSGNAPELRCYGEASSPERAATLVDLGLDVARRLAPEI